MSQFFIRFRVIIFLLFLQKSHSNHLRLNYALRKILKHISLKEDVTFFSFTQSLIHLSHLSSGFPTRCEIRDEDLVLVVGKEP